MTHLSVVIPAYNEGKLIRDNLTRIINYLGGKSYDWEIVVVDDGSLDSTNSVVKEMKNKKVKLIKHERNLGKGAALKSGVAISNGKYIMFMDADLSVPVKYVGELLSKLESGIPVVVGSRRIGKSVIAKHQPLIREQMGVVFTKLARMVTGVKLNDFTCGFKGFEAKAGKKIFLNSVINRWAYDSEILFLANKFGYKINQIPVRWVNREDSRVEGMRAVITVLIDLIRIRINDLRGVYEK